MRFSFKQKKILAFFLIYDIMLFVADLAQLVEQLICNQ